MSRSKQVVKYRRKREGKTNYHKRLELLKSKKSRLVVRRTQKYIDVQLISYEPSGDKIQAHANTKELKKLGWNFSCKNLPSAYLVGLLLCKKANGIKEAILDLGQQRSISKSRIFATVKGVIDGGIVVPCSEEVLPDEDRLKGKHITDYISKLDENQRKKLFSKYVDKSPVSEAFDTVKKKIEG